MGAFHGWNWAKALYLQSLLGEANAKERSLQVLETALARGGQSSWFNRMRASLNRARQQRVPAAAATEYADVLLRAFDDLLERVGSTGNRFDRWSQQVTDGLRSDRHDQFAEAIERLGTLLGYHATRPRHQAATDCRWRGVFGNQKEVVTFEVKIEHTGQVAIVPTGRPHDTQLNVLIDAAFYAAGRKDGFHMDATALDRIEKRERESRMKATAKILNPSCPYQFIP